MWNNNNTKEINNIIHFKYKGFVAIKIKPTFGGSVNHIKVIVDDISIKDWGFIRKVKRACSRANRTNSDCNRDRLNTSPLHSDVTKKEVDQLLAMCVYECSYLGACKLVTMNEAYALQLPTRPGN